MTAQLCQIRASAGSGKTHTLTLRFVALLAGTPLAAHTPQCAMTPQAASGVARAPRSWGDILAVTFTNAAAAEMRDRVLYCLKSAALGLARDAPVPAAEAAARVDLVLRQYGALNIRTIDSLLNMVVRTAALELGLPPDFAPAFAGDEVLLPLLEACITKAEVDPATADILKRACEALVYDGGAAGFTAGERIVKPLQALLESILLGRCEGLAPAGELRARCRALRQNLTDAANALLALCEEEKPPLNANARKAFLACLQEPVTTTSTYLGKASVDECLNGKATGSPRLHAAYAALVRSFKEWTVDAALLQKGVSHAPLVELGKHIAQDLRAFEQREGKVPGVLIPQLAREVLLGEHGVSAALCRLGSRVSHIFIDEFQDTSHDQWQALHPLVLEALSTGGRLTWVGDVKQAIYGWRGGDASLFGGIAHDPELAAICPQPQFEALPTNWRSLRAIVEFNNKWAAILGDAAVANAALEAILPNLAREFAPLRERWAERVAEAFTDARQECCCREGAAGPEPTGHVSLRLLTGKTLDDLAALVREALRERMDDLLARFAPEDVAILVRTNKEGSEVAAWLMEWGIPVITENSLLMQEHPLVCESLAWLKWLAAPQDNTALWTVLTGELLAERVQATGGRPLADVLSAYINRATPVQAPACGVWRLERQDVRRTRRTRVSLADFLAEREKDTWNACLAPFRGGFTLPSAYDSVQEWYRFCRAEERFPEQRIFLRRFLELLHMAGKQGHATPSAFLEYWEQHGAEEKVPMPETTPAVRVMTIHKSKGLQFPVVIVPHTHFNNEPDKRIRLHEIDGLRFVAPLSQKMGAPYYEEACANAVENLHNWYVACTRAVKELHVLVTDAAKLNKRLTAGLCYLLDQAGLGLTEETPARTWGEPVLPARPLPAPEAAPAIPAPAAVCDGGLPAFTPMDWLPRLNIYRNPLREISSSPTRRGIFVHHCLELVRCTGEPAADAARAVEQGERTFTQTLPRSAAAADMAAATAMLTWFLDLPDAPRWLASGSPEQSLMDATGAVCRVDLLVPPGEGQPHYLCIDYKTGAPDPAHREQMRRYLRLLASLPGAASLPAPRGLLVYLEQQRLDHVGLAGGPQ